MEAQSLLLGFSSIQNPKNANILAIPTPFSSSSSPYQLPNLVSFKTHNLSVSPQIVTSNKRLNCKSSSIVEAEIGADKVEDFELGIRRKNLAVFVSGGGSNFRSIHEAILRGSILGDIVVLVASKPGKVYTILNAVYVLLVFDESILSSSWSYLYIHLSIHVINFIYMQHAIQFNCTGKFILDSFNSKQITCDMLKWVSDCVIICCILKYFSIF